MALLEEVIYITSLADQKISIKQMRDVWSLLYKSQVMPIYKRTKTAEKFVIELHRFLRKSLGLLAENRGWNLFFSVMEEQGCNCLCSSIFILMAAHSVGYFPSQLMYGHTGDHIFLINKQGNKAFDTTFTCPTNWLTIDQLFSNLELNSEYENISVDNTIDHLISLYLISVISYNYSTIKNEAFTLLSKYPSLEDPSYLAMVIQVNNKEKFYDKDLNALIEDYQLFTDTVEDYKLVGSFATVIQLMSIIVDPYYKRDVRLLRILERLIKLLEISNKHSPENLKIKQALTYLRAVQRRGLLIVKHLGTSKVTLPSKITLSKLPSLI